MPTGIQWTDETWNPVTGCDKVSPGCDHCYIERSIPFRMEGRKFDENGKMGVRVHLDRLDKPLRWRKPRRVFVNSLSDLFHPDLTDEFIARVFAAMAFGKQHTFQILTKRPQRMAKLLNNDAFKELVWSAMEAVVEDTDSALTRQERWNFHKRVGAWLAPTEWPLSNVWLGTSVESQQYADMRIKHLLATPAAKRFLSMEPLLGPVSLTRWTPPRDPLLDLLDSEAAMSPSLPSPPPLIDWVIVGGESGPGARPMHVNWARSVRDQCVEAKVPFFFKQWGEWTHWPYRDSEGQWRGEYSTEEPWHLISKEGEVGPIPFGGWGRETYASMGWEPMGMVGKKKAGRELDEVLWDEFPDE